MADQRPQTRDVSSTGLVIARVLLFPLFVGLCGLVLPAQAIELFGIRLFEPEDEDEDIADPLSYTVTVEMTGGGPALEAKLENVSSLVQDADQPVSGSLGLLAKARSDREQIVAALYQEARYDGVVEISVGGRPLDEFPPDADLGSGPVPVAVTVDAGGVFTLGAVQLNGDAAGLSPATFGLIPGGEAGSDAILKAENEIVARLKEEGRPLARVTSRDVIADHATNTLDVALTVSAGPIAGYGDTLVSGTEQVDRDFTGYMAGLPRGRIYSPRDLEDARERLRGLEVFSSVTVREVESLDVNGAIPIAVEVSERKMRYYGVGGTLSNTEGLGLEGYWGHRNLFGRAEKLRVEGSVGRIGEASGLGDLNYSSAVMFEKPGVIGPDGRFFANLRAVAEHPDAYDRFSIRGGVGLAYEFTRSQSASVELAVDYSDIEDVFNPDGARHLLVSVPLNYVFDNRDDVLNPSSGFRAAAFVEPTYDTIGGATFVKLRGDVSAYRAVDEAARFVIAARAAAGSIIGAGLSEIPADRRFYVGGGGSVRGYAYQGIGPRDLDGRPTGGRSFAETSLELRIAINDRLGIVPFVDGGSVSESEFPDFSGFKTGAGIGIRYLTPFGPLRLDAAVPLNKGPDDPDFGIYAGVGQAF